MKKIQINLLDLEENPETSSTIPHKPLSQLLLPKAIIVFFSFLLLLTTATTVLSYKSVKDQHSTLNRAVNAILSFGPFNQLTRSGEKYLIGEKEDRVNILLLGIGGKGHEGTNLTDTILLASIKPSEKEMALFSIPRDLIVPIPGHGWRKINNANAFGELINPGYGPELARKTLSDLFGIPIHYYIRVDFKAFYELIDLVGGVNVCVEKSFTDYKFPTADWKYQIVSFKEGCQEMNGDRALKFVRSRHSPFNHEGSDFARSKRQQKILLALKEKLFSAQFLLNPKKVADLLGTYTENVATNIVPWELIKIAHLVKNFNESATAAVIFDDDANGYLVSNTVEGAYVLQPRDGTFDAMRKKISDIFSEEYPIETIAAKNANYPAEPEDVQRTIVKNIRERNQQESPRTQGHASITILNGTLRTGLASRTAELLKKKGYAISSIGNASQRDYVQTILLDKTNGIKKESLDEIKALFNAEVGSETKDISSYQSDFILILGNDVSQ